ncbi:MAG TPA: glycosyltransferase family 2 protein [Candidatus Thermoplasmatota archaeon]
MPKATKPTAPHASVIVVTHNSSPYIRDCLTSVFQQQYRPGFEVIVVDSASTDTTRDIVRSRFKKAHLIESKNRGFGAANNLGVKHARGKIVAFANPDTVAEQYWLAELAAPLTTRGTITTSQVLLMSSPSRINTLGLSLHFMGLSFVRGLDRPAIDAEPGEVPGFSGAAFAMRRDDYRRLNGFDEEIFLYGEDAELSWRARREGFRILGVPKSRIRHHYRLRMDAKKLYHLERSRLLLLRKSLNPAQKFLYAPSIGLSRAMVSAYARRYGYDGRDAIRRARKEAKDVHKAPKSGTAIRSFARRTIPFSTAFPESAAARRFGFLANVVYWLNSPLPRKHPKWLRAPR